MQHCAKLTQEYVDQWFEDHKNDQAKLKEAEKYNTKFYKTALDVMSGAVFFMSNH